MQLLVVLASALVSLVVLAVLVGVVLKRRPLLLVADELPGTLYDGANDVGDLISGPDGEEAVARAGVDATTPDADRESLERETDRSGPDGE